MTNNHQYRQLLAGLNICDDRAERALTQILQDKDTALQLERDRVADKVWRLEDKLMKMEVQNAVPR